MKDSLAIRGYNHKAEANIEPFDRLRAFGIEHSTSNIEVRRPEDAAGQDRATGVPPSVPGPWHTGPPGHHPRAAANDRAMDVSTISGAGPIQSKAVRTLKPALAGVLQAPRLFVPSFVSILVVEFGWTKIETTIGTKIKKGDHQARNGRCKENGEWTIPSFPEVETESETGHCRDDGSGAVGSGSQVFLFKFNINHRARFFLTSMFDVDCSMFDVRSLSPRPSPAR